MSAEDKLKLEQEKKREQEFNEAMYKGWEIAHFIMGWYGTT